MFGVIGQWRDCEIYLRSTQRIVVAGITGKSPPPARNFAFKCENLLFVIAADQ
jgi:hypothetical protein